MIKVLSYLKKSAVPIVIIVVLLVVQAMCDLALPECMSNIVNIGIQQGGIETPVPKVITEESFAAVTSIMRAEERELASSGYKKETINGIPAYRLSNTTPELENLMKKSTCIIALVKNAEKYGMNDENGIAEIKADINKSIVEQLYTAVTEKLGEDTIIQSGISFLSDEYRSLDINESTPYILKTGLKMLGFTLVIAFSTLVVTLLASRTAALCAKDLREDVFKKVIGFSSMEFNKFSTTSLITRCTNDIQQVQILIIMVLKLVLYAPILGIGALLKVTDNGSMTWIIGVAVLAILSLIVVLFVVAMPKFKSLQKLVDKINLISREILNGLPVIRAFGREKYEEERFDGANVLLTKTNLFVNRVMAFLMPAMMFIMNGTSLLIVWIGAGAIENSQLQVGDVMAFIQYAMQIIISFLMLSMLSILLPRALISAGRISDVLKSEISITNPKSTQEFPSNIKGSVEFKNVSFKYPGANECVLRNISFKVEKGQTLAIIGSTGCGKSTLVNLIPRFFDVTEGQITVDGVDIRNADLGKLRDKLGYVPQKGVLFSGTIASNIGYGSDDNSQENIERAAKIAQADGFIQEKPNQYMNEVAQGGVNVSGGQRQRLAIARAIAKNPEIYIFDDSFSALDFKTDSALRKALNEIQGITKIIVAQRISTVLHADIILVLEDGKIVGEGTHEQLMKDCQAYVQIATSQLSREEIDV